MRKSLASLAAGAALLFVALQPAAAGLPRDGLAAITVSADGKTVYAAGDNRVLYVLDAGTLEVRKRAYLGLNPYELILSGDGKMLVLHDSSGLLTMLDAESLEMKGRIEGAEAIATAPEAGIIFAVGKAKGRGPGAVTPLAAYRIATGEQVMQSSVKGKVVALAALPDGSRLHAMTDDYKSDAEEKKKPPKGMSGVERRTFVQKNDGKVSDVITLDANGTESGRFTTFMELGWETDFVATPDELRIVSNNGVAARLSPDGTKAELFEAGGTYGFSFSPDGTRLAAGSLRKGELASMDSAATVPFKASRIGGWPEYFEGFAFGPDGHVYGGTSAYRLFKMDGQGRVVAEAPVF